MKSAFGATLIFILMGYALILPSTASAGPSSAITSPKNLSIINTTSVTNSFITVTGTATTDTGTLSEVEVKVNDGSWKRATGTGSWSFSFQVHASGIYHIRSKATDSLGAEENPGDGVKVDVVLPSVTGSISGTASYAGVKPGDVIVAAFTDPHFVGGSPLVFKDIVNPGAYTLDGVPAGTFYVGAVKTVVGSSGVDIQATDPIGAYGTVAAPTPVTVSGNAVTGKNITLNNTSSNPLYIPAEARAHYVDWGGTPAMWVDFDYSDPNQTASTVTVTGPGISSPISLAYDTNEKRWVSWGANGGPHVSLQLPGTADDNTWPPLPATYTFTVDGVASTKKGILRSYMTDLPTHLSPSGDVYGSVVFSWAPVPTALFYEIEISGQSDPNFHWSLENAGHNNFTGTSYKYDGPALVDGNTYSYSVSARDVNDSDATKSGSLIYHTSDDTAPPSSTITSPDSASPVSGDYLVSSGVSGTALDDAAGSGVQAIEVSIDGGTNWLLATGTTNWNILWPSPGPPANIPLLNIKSRAIDLANNYETPSSGINITIDITKPTSAFTYPTNNAYVTTLPFTITGTASDTGSGVDHLQVSPDNGAHWRGPGSGLTDTSAAHDWSTWSYTTGDPPLVDGAYTALCQALDKAGNLQDPITAITIIVDTTPPIVSVDSPVNNAALNGTTAAINGSASDATSGMAKVEVSTDGGATWKGPATTPAVTDTSTGHDWSTWSYTWTLPADRNYTVKARATDKAGNVTPLASIPSISVKVDKTKPAVAITSPTASAWVKGSSFNVTGTASDATSGVDSVSVSADGGLPVSATDNSAGHNWATWTYNWPLPMDGPHTLAARVTDKAGNTQTTATLSVKVDRTLPSSAITLPNNNAILNGASYVIRGTALDTTSGVRKVEISTDGGTAWPYTAIGTTAWSFTWTLPANGSYNILSRATDVAGNVETPGAGVTTVTVNKTMPISAITAPVTGKALKGPAAITGTAFRGASATATSVTKVEVSTDDGTTWKGPTDTPAVKDTSGYPTSGLPRFSTWSYAWTPTTEGPNALVSKATNNLGVEDITNSNKAAVNVIFDKTPPSTSITAPTDGSILKGTTASITGTASDGPGSGLAKVEVSTNGGATWVAALGTASWSYTWTLPLDGLYTLKARGTDKAGNVQITVPSVSVRVDKTKPTAALTTPPLTGISIPAALGTYSIKGTAADAAGSGVQKVEVSTDGGSTWNPVTSGTTSWYYHWTLPADGSYNIKAKSWDNAGNESLIPAGRTVKVDGIAPIAAWTQPFDKATLNGTSYVIKGTASDAISGVKKMEVGIMPAGGSTTWYPATGTTAWSYTWTLPANGGYEIWCRATDNAGNQSVYWRDVTVDKTSPVSTVSAPASGKALKGTTTITGMAFKGASPTATSVTKVEVSTDGGTTWDTLHPATDTSGYPTSGLPRFSTWSYAWTSPAEGPYTLVSRATNNLPNVEVITNKPVVAVIVDKTNPTSSITAPAGGAVLKGATYSITGTADDPVNAGVASAVAKVEVSTNNGVTWVPATDTSGNGSWSSWSYTWTLGVDGQYTLKSRATDKAGNVLLTGDSSVSVRIDKTRPTSAITSPPAGANISGASKTITGTAGDGATGSGVALVEVGITPSGGSTTWLGPADGVTDTSVAHNWSSWSYDWNPLPVVDGNYNIKTKATDRAGNVQIPGAGITVKVDNTLPVVAITAPADGALINTLPLAKTVTGTASDVAGSGLLKVEVSFDGGGTWKPAVDTSGYPTSGKAPWSTWRYAWTITTTATTSITARATDKALNTETDVHAVTVSPKLFSGTWNYTFTPVTGGGSARTGTVPLVVNDAGTAGITYANSCSTHYDGSITGMSATLSTGGDACNDAGDMTLTFTTMKKATGTVTGANGPGSTASLSISR